MLFSDTDPQTEAVLVALLRQASPARKLDMVGELNATVRTLASTGLRQRFPGASSAELQRRLADLLLGPDLASQVYGPLTEALSTSLATFNGCGSWWSRTSA